MNDFDIEVLDHSNECECEYDDDMNLVWICKKEACFYSSNINSN